MLQHSRKGWNSAWKVPGCEYWHSMKTLHRGHIPTWANVFSLSREGAGLPMGFAGGDGREREGMELTQNTGSLRGALHMFLPFYPSEDLWGVNPWTCLIHKGNQRREVLQLVSDQGASSCTGMGALTCTFFPRHPACYHAERCFIQADTHRDRKEFHCLNNCIWQEWQVILQLPET